VTGERFVKLYRTSHESYVEKSGNFYRVPERSWDALVTHDNLREYLAEVIEKADPAADFASAQVLAPIENQEVWAAGVTYYRSRSARMEESKDAGGGDFYDRVYSAERPELFFKSTAGRVAGPGSHVRIRSDASWSVPEPELTLLLNQRGELLGYTVGNDMSSRDIEGENPLYLPQAKVYDRSCALGPCILVTSEDLPSSTPIHLEILRGGRAEFTGATTLEELKRKPATLAEYLFRDNSFPFGAFLMTGTGIVPPDSFTLEAGDQIRITIEPIGTLINDVAPKNR
jgi:2-dehydro-3-deoxy-D-arabinonate dehydratase